MDAEPTEDQAVDDSSDGADAADDEAAPPTTAAPEPTPTPTTAPAGDVALTVDFGDETWELTHGEINEVVIDSWENQEFVDSAFGGSVPPGFYVGVANEHLIGKILDRELVTLEATVDDAATDEARSGLLAIMEGWFPTSADPAGDAERLFGEVPYLPFVVDLQSKQEAMRIALEGSDDLKASAPCVRHILLEEEAEAQEVLDLLNDGGDFAALAAERSTGPTGPTGGDLGCSPSSNYVPEFAAAVDGAEFGEYVGPVQTQFGFHVLVVDRVEETDVDPASVINDRVGEALGSIGVEVDPRIGTWDTTSLSIISAG